MFICVTLQSFVGHIVTPDILGAGPSMWITCPSTTRLRHRGHTVSDSLGDTQSVIPWGAAVPVGARAAQPSGPSDPLVYLSCGHAVSLVVQWVDVTRLEKNATLLFPESIRVDTRDQELFFSMFLNIGETFKLMEQLANLAMRQLLDSEGFLEDKALPRPSRPHRNISALKR